MNINKVLEKIPESDKLVNLINQDLNNKTGFSKELAKKLLPEVMRIIYNGNYPNDPHIIYLINYLKQKYPQMENSEINHVLGGNTDEENVQIFVITFLSIILGVIGIINAISYMSQPEQTYSEYSKKQELHTTIPVVDNWSDTQPSNEELYLQGIIPAYHNKINKSYDYIKWDKSWEILEESPAGNIFVGSSYQKHKYKLLSMRAETNLTYNNKEFRNAQDAYDANKTNNDLIKILVYKFSKDKNAAASLIQTGESNLYYAIKDAKLGIQKTKNSPGYNIIGIILMEIRNLLNNKIEKIRTETGLKEFYYKNQYKPSVIEKPKNASYKTEEKPSGLSQQITIPQSKILPNDVGELNILLKQLNIEIPPVGDNNWDFNNLNHRKNRIDELQKLVMDNDRSYGIKVAGCVAGGLIKLSELKMLCSLFVCCILLILILIYIYCKLPECSWLKKKSYNSSFDYY